MSNLGFDALARFLIARENVCRNYKCNTELSPFRRSSVDVKKRSEGNIQI